MSTPRVLLIEPLSSAVHLIPIADRLGIPTVVVSYDRGDRRLPDGFRSLVDEIAVVDPNDDAALIECVGDLHAKHEIGAVLPGIEYYVAKAARVAEHLGVPGHPSDRARALRDKSFMLEVAQAAGLRVPLAVLAHTRSELSVAAEQVGFPAVLKPVASAGSTHVTRVDDSAGLFRAYDAMLVDRRPDDVGQCLDGVVLLEEYLSGPEISVEGYVHAGRAVVLTLTHKLLGAEPSFVETGHIVQYPAPQAQRATIEAYVTDLCRALGVALGPFHCELRLVDGAPVLVELGARLPGGRITDLIEIVTGVSLHRVMLATHLGLAPDAFGTAALPQAGCAGIHNLTAPDIERVTSIRGVHEVRRLPYVRDVSLDVAPGSPVPPYGDWRSRLGQVMFVADDYSEAMQHRELIEAMVQIV